MSNRGTEPVQEFDAECPHCGTLNQVHGHESGEMPSPDDWTICWTCLGPGVYTEGLAVRKMTAEELMDQQFARQYVILRERIQEARHPSDLFKPP